MIAALAAGVLARPWARTALRWGAVRLAVILFLLSLRRAGERAGRMAERLETVEKTDAVHRRVLEAAARRPRGHDGVADRLRGHECRQELIDVAGITDPLSDRAADAAAFVSGIADQAPEAGRADRDLRPEVVERAPAALGIYDRAVRAQAPHCSGPERRSARVRSGRAQ